MPENKTISADISETYEQPRAVLVRIPSEIAARIDADAQERGTNPTEIVRAIIREHYNKAANHSASVIELNDLIEDRFGHIVYEISRTRASLYHIAQQSPGLQISTDMLRKIFEVTCDDARMYLDKLEAEMKRRQSVPEQNAGDSAE